MIGYEPGSNIEKDNIIITHTNNMVTFLKICDFARCSLTSKERKRLVNTIKIVGEGYNNDEYLNLSCTLVKNSERSEYVKNIVYRIKQVLEEHNITVCGKTSVNGNSFYLSLDNSVLHGIRVSDHATQRDFGFCQNVLVFGECYTKIIKKNSSGKKVIHYTVPDSELYISKVVSEVVGYVLKEKEEIINKFGLNIYTRRKIENASKNAKLLYKHDF